MENIYSFWTVLSLTATVLFVLLGMRLTRRLNNRVELALAAGLIVFVGFSLARMEVNANRNAQATVATIFRLEEGLDILAFRRKSSKEQRSQSIEIIYQFSPDSFEAYKGNTFASIGEVSFKYRSGTFSNLKIDRFAISEGSLEWKVLPRLKSTSSGYLPIRGHNSYKFAPDEDAMIGEFLCAFITVNDAKTAPESGFAVSPCHTIRESNPEGISILGILNENDKTLHVHIQSSKVPAAGFRN